LAFKNSEKAPKSSKPELKKRNSSADFNKMGAGDVCCPARKKATMGNMNVMIDMMKRMMKSMAMRDEEYDPDPDPTPARPRLRHRLILRTSPR